MDVEVKILDQRVISWGFPVYGSDWAAGLDLFACIEDEVCLEPQEPARLIPTGIAIHIGDPEWCGLVLPRSGLGHKTGLVLGNTVGLIDPDYIGPCLISAWNRNPNRAGQRQNASIKIRPGDRIAQLVLTRIVRPKYRIVNELMSSERRGEGGFGSTGGASAMQLD